MAKTRKKKLSRKDRKRPAKDKLRLFVAHKLSTTTSSALAFEESRLEAAGADVNWVDEENLHITLKFLGNVETKAIPEVLAGLKKAAQNLEEFEIEVAGVAFFPSSLRPKTVAVGVDSLAREALTEVAAQVEDALSELGFGRSRKTFKPHITLGRVKSNRGMGALSEALLISSGEPFGIERVDELVLIMSELKRSGPLYTVLGRVSF